MIKAGVIGYPISHSLSPKLHGYWLQHYQIAGSYERFEVAPEELGVFIRSMEERGLAGVNVTIPHKESVMAYLDEISPLAQSIGAVNTIVIKDGKRFGYNTDAYGFLANIRPQLRGKKKAVVLGAGGAAKAVWHALAHAGFETIIATNRTASKLDHATGCQIAAWEERSALLQDTDLLVNTTSLGMRGKDALEMDLSLLPVHALVTDIVYTPLITPLLAAAKARGNPVVDGLGMLLHQGAPGFAAWFLGQALTEMPASLEAPAVTEQLRQMIVAT